MEKKHSLYALSETLNSMFHEMNIENRMELYKIYSIWQKAVGAKIAEQTFPEKLSRGLLFVNVSNSVWMQELHFLRDIILEKINKELTCIQLREIRFKIGVLPRSEDKTDSVQPPSLNKLETEKIRKDASSIKDEDMRQSFHRMMEAYLKNRKRVE